MSDIIPGKTHTFFSPNKILFGLDTCKSVAEEVQRLRGKKVLLLTDPGVEQAGVLRPVQEALESARIPFAFYDRVEPEPAARLVDEATELFRSEGCDMVVGVGGGSTLDVTKGVAVMATNMGSILDVCGMDLVRERGVPKILLPTTAGTGSEVTRVLVITDEAESTKKAVYSAYTLAEVAIVDPMLTLTAPQTVTADSGVDALVHAIETYVSVNATPFSDVLAERAIELIAEYLPMAWAKGSNLKGRYHTALGSLLAGMAFASGGLGAVHALSYPLGTEYHMPHGRSNAVMLPHVMRYNLPGSLERYAVIASLLGKEVEGLDVMEAAGLAVDAVEELLETLQVPYRLRDYDIEEGDIGKLAEGGVKQARLFVPNPRDLDLEDVRSIYQMAY